MSSLFCRLFHRLLRNPTLIIVVFFCLSLCAFVPISLLKVNTSFLDLFDKDSQVKRGTEEFQSKFGTFSSLDLVLEQKDPLLAQAQIAKIRQQFLQQTEIRFIESQPKVSTLGDFKWYYLSLSDLDTLLSQVHTQKAKLDNPLLADLLPPVQTSVFDEILKRYQINSQQWLGNTEGTIRILHIYPKTDPTDPIANARLVNIADSILQPYLKQSRIELTGPIYESAHRESNLLENFKKPILWGLGLSFGLLLLLFWRTPAFAPISIITLGSTSAICLGIWSLLFHQIHVLILLLTPIALSMGSDSSIHFLSRYKEERRKGLSPRLSLETVLLETGPSLCRSNWTSTLGFLSLLMIPFPGIRDFGLFSALFLMLLWLHNLLLFPALMLQAECKGLIRWHGPKLQNLVQFIRLNSPGWKLPALLLGIGIVSIYPFSAHPIFDREMGLQNHRLSWADSCNQIWGQSISQAAYLKAPELNQLNSLQENANLRLNRSAVGGQAYTQYQILPRNQKEKQAKLQQIQSLLSPELVQLLPQKLQVSAQDFRQKKFGDTLTLALLPKILSIPNPDQLGHYLFLTSNRPLQSMDDFRAFASAISTLSTPTGQTLYSAGHPLLIAEYLRQSMPHLSSALLFMFIAITLLLLWEYRDPVYLLMLLIPSSLGALTIISLLKLFQTPFHAFNIYLVPLYLGYSMAASMHLLNRYLEEGRGSLRFILQRTVPGIFKSALISLAGFAVFWVSPMPMAKDLGVIGCASVLASLFAALLVQPLFLILVDRGRWAEHLKSRRAQ